MWPSYIAAKAKASESREHRLSARIALGNLRSKIKTERKEKKIEERYARAAIREKAIADKKDQLDRKKLSIRGAVAIQSSVKFKPVVSQQSRLEAAARYQSIRRHLSGKHRGTYQVGVGTRKYDIPKELAGVQHTTPGLGARSSLKDSWPFVSDNDLLVMKIDSVVPKWMGREMRAEVCQDIAVMVLDGSVDISDIKELVPVAKSKFNRMFNRTITDVQLSLPVWRDNDRVTLADMLVSPPRSHCFDVDLG